MVHREYGLIVQHDIYDLAKAYDGGDSSCRCGIMALFGSKLDQEQMPKFYLGNGLLCRNPYQPPKWNSPSNFSRDQLIPCIGGMTTNPACLGHLKSILRRTLERGSRFFSRTQNGDILAPDVMLYMHICADESPGLLLFWSGLLWHLLAIFYTARLRSNTEQNQLMCICKVFGTLKLWKMIHPNWKKSIYVYFDNWRDQPEICEQLIAECNKLS